MAAAAAPFRGFSPAAIQFLADLADNNDRAWFQPRKAEFERLLKEPMEAMIASLANRLAARGVPIEADPKRAPFRIYRDTRFSKDKSPYKTHLGASFPWVGGSGVHVATGAAHVPADGSHEARTHGNGGYFHFQPGEMYVGGGMWRMEKATLDAFRERVRDHPAEVRAALEDAGFRRAWGEARAHEELKRFPPGWPHDHPMAPTFLWKNVVFGRRLSDEEALSPDLPDILAEGFSAATPIFNLLASLP